MSERDPVWNLDRLEELVAGAIVRCEGPPEDIQRVQALLGPHAGELADSPIGARLRAYHPDDRAPLAAAWQQALDRPAEVVAVHARLLDDDRWFDARIQFLNLVDDAMGVILVVTRVGDGIPDGDVPPPIEEPVVPGFPASWVLLRMALDGRVLHAEGTSVALTGLAPSELEGVNIIDTIHPDDRAAAITFGGMAASLPGVARSMEHRGVRPDGSVVWVESTVTYDPDADEMQVLLVDIDQRRAERAALETSRRQIQELAEEFRLLAEEVPTGAFRTDPDGRVLFANERFRALAGNRDVTDLRELARPTETWIVDDALTRVLDDSDQPGVSRDAVQIEFLERTEGRPLSLRLSAVRAGGGQRRGVIGILIDAGPTVELRSRARTDPLTGLLNRAALNQHLESSLPPDGDGALCVLFVDFDGFKEVNDRHGHHAGDEVLRVVARRLRNAVRSTEEIGRYGGDEFVVACAVNDPDTVANLRERIEAALADPVHFDDGLWQPEASIGLALAETDDTAASLLRRADADMYRVKHAKPRPRRPEGPDGATDR